MMTSFPRETKGPAIPDGIEVNARRTRATLNHKTRYRSEANYHSLIG
jgi:hypothetical protein